MKDTIKAKEGYWIGKNQMLSYNYGENARAVLDGQKVVMICTMTSLEEYQENREQNECFMQCEVFTTRDGNQFIYWTDIETGEDFITKISS